MRLGLMAGESDPGPPASRCRSLRALAGARADHRRDRRSRHRRDRRRCSLSSTPRCFARCRTPPRTSWCAFTPTRHRTGSGSRRPITWRSRRSRRRFAQVAGYTERVGGLQRRAKSPNSFADGWCRGRISICSASNRRSAARFTAGRRTSRASPPAVIVSHRFWQQRLGSSADAIGKPIRSTAWTTSLTGVMPAAVGPARAQPGFLHRGAVGHTAPQGPVFHHHPRPRVAAPARASAAAELRAINKPHLSALALVLPGRTGDVGPWWISKSHSSHDFKPIARLSLVAVALVWLIACVNASNLLVARVTSRRRELAVRTRARRFPATRDSLSARRKRGAGGRRGGRRRRPRARSASVWCSALARPSCRATTEIALAGRALWVLVAVTAISGAIFGLVPALHGTGGPVDEGLRSLGRSSTGSRACPASAPGSSSAASSRSRRRC